MRDAGRIEVTLTLAGERVAAVDLVSTRPRGLTRAMIGRDPARVPDLLQLLFPMCRMAHAIACASATEAASGHAPSAATIRARGMILVAERFDALAWRFGMDAPALLGRPEESKAVVAVRAATEAFRCVVDPSGRVATPFAHVDDVTPTLLEPTLAAAKAALRAFSAYDGTLSLLEGLAVAFEARGLGAHPLPLAPARDPAWYDHAFVQDPGFSERPSLVSSPAEVGPLAARGRADGSTLSARIAAQIDQLATEPRTLRHLVEGDASAPTPIVHAATPGTATAVVETTRGPLAYRVEVEADRLRALANAAPTEWNFHPRGPFVASLEGARVGDWAGAEAYARFAAFSFDPCVPLVPRVAAERPEALHA